MTTPTDEEMGNMSDEDFMKLAVPETEEAEVVKEELETPVEEEEVEEELDLDTPVKEEEDSELPETGENEPNPEAEETVPEKDKEEEAEPEERDYKAELDKALADNAALMAPFKANGVDITPKSIEDAKRLQQMGANYHKKMSGMKPALKALKTLENNELLTDGRLDFLIDLNKGNPDAIAKFLKEKQINLDDLDLDAESTYTPTDYSASDTQVELDSVLKDLETSPNYEKTVNVVTEWDPASRKELIANPQFIGLINEQMDSGIYDKVIGAVTYERSMGKLKGVTDFDAYKTIGNKLEAAGAFAESSNPVKEVEQKPAPKAKTDPVKEKKRMAKKKAATTSRSSGKAGKLPVGFNPLELSDEDFKKFDPRLIGIK